MKMLFLEIETGREWAMASPGPAAVAAMVRKGGHAAEMLRVPLGADPDATACEVVDRSPDLVGFSLTTRQWLRAREVARAVKRRTGVPIIAGGAHPTFAPGHVLAEPAVDMACIGDGEGAVLDILEHLRAGRSPLEEKIPNVATAANPDPATRPAEDPDSLPFMARDILDETNGVAHMVTRRGCPLGCAYCAAGALEKRFPGRRRRSVGNVLAELAELDASRGFQYIIFLDDTFTLDRNWVLEFCRKYGERFGQGFSIHARADTVGPGMLKALAKAGCRHVVFGVESGSERVRREIMNRPVSDEQLVRAFGDAGDAGLMATANYMLGIPGETPADVEATLKLNERLAPADFGWFVFYPFPGTPLFDQCREQGLLPDDPFSLPVSQRRSILRLPELPGDVIAKYYERFAEARVRRWEALYGANLDPAGREQMLERLRMEAALD